MKKGFTLIELLVVVLIIGILAAIALPQYTKAVEKSRVAEALSLGRSIQDACDRLYMQNGERVCTDWDSLDITVPGEVCDHSGASCRKTKNFQYFAFADDAFEAYKCTNDSCDEWDYAIEFYPYFDGAATLNGQRYCQGQTDKGNKVCASLGGTKISASRYLLP
ncbi:prepilin-type N-terminal cleavage/methylation domain-containing protein [Elusimicrobium posterum]|uniref:type IV pilin protein n=1 Tax=Elusimicrobium posterum TaxID=3116653 RepID=UPI003C74F8B2